MTVSDQPANRPCDEADGDVLTALAEDLDVGFAELVRAHQRIVYSVALAITSRTADAEDLAADAFLRAYRSLRTFDRQRMARLKVRPWLMTILLNTGRNWRRDSGRRPTEVPLDELGEFRHPGPAVEDLAELAEWQREAVRLIHTLPENQRISVVLRHVVGLPTIEVADILGCPEGTAKSHISRGLQRLRVLCERRAP